MKEQIDLCNYTTSSNKRFLKSSFYDLTVCEKIGFLNKEVFFIYSRQNNCFMVLLYIINYNLSIYVAKIILYIFKNLQKFDFSTQSRTLYLS